MDSHCISRRPVRAADLRIVLLARRAEPRRHRRDRCDGAQHSHRVHRPDLARQRGVHGDRRIHDGVAGESRTPLRHRDSRRGNHGGARGDGFRRAVFATQGPLSRHGDIGGAFHRRIRRHALGLGDRRCRRNERAFSVALRVHARKRSRARVPHPARVHPAPVVREEPVSHPRREGVRRDSRSRHLRRGDGRRSLPLQAARSV